MTTTPCPLKTTTARSAPFFSTPGNYPGTRWIGQSGQTPLTRIGADRIGNRPLLGTRWEFISASSPRGQLLYSLLEATQITDCKPILRAQLPLLLAKVNGSYFAQLLFDWFNIVLDDEQKRWFLLDGKELRGNNQRSDTRGEVLVSALDHQTHQVVAQTCCAEAKNS